MRTRPSITGLASAVIGGAVAVLYVVLIVQQGDRDMGGAPQELGSFSWAVLLFALPVVVGTGSVLQPSSTGRGLLGAGAAGLTLTGVLALFSIGLPLMVAAVLAWVALATRHTAR